MCSIRVTNKERLTTRITGKPIVKTIQSVYHNEVLLVYVNDVTAELLFTTEMEILPVYPLLILLKSHGRFSRLLIGIP